MNRSNYTPIFFAAALLLADGPIFVAEAQTAAAPSQITNTAPAATPAPSPATPDTSAAPTEQPATYTVVSGDSLWLIAHKFHTSVRKLKKLNKLTTNNLKPGQVIQLPPATSSTTPATPAQPKTTSHHKVKTVQPTKTEVAGASQAEPETAAQPTGVNDSVNPSIQAPQPVVAVQAKPLHHHKKKTVHPQEPEVAGAHRAQPVQDFDVPASTFASCPVPVPVDPDATDASPAPAESGPGAEEEAPMPRAVPVSPVTPDATSTSGQPADPVAEAPVAESAPAPGGQPSSQSSKRSGPALATDSALDNGPTGPVPSSANDWADRFRTEAENLANLNIDYDEEWCPPGESHAWAMDCSNTARYLYKITTGLELPRTASDQYYYLHLQNKAWDVPQGPDGFADTNYLRENLKPGDLLFWENTYRPERQPPITHVMIFLGTNDHGQWIMAGSQTSRGGLHNRRHGGPDIYVFDPNKPCGGYSTWLGLVHHQGRFCAFGRPLEADPAKLSVATDK
jgi:cell wall-associated NlpC family hydrolase